MLETFGCVNLRCFKNKKFDFSDFTLIEGKNGSGKTTILEGIYICVRGRSFLTGRLSNLVRHGEYFFKIESIFEGNTISVFYDGKNKKKDFLFNEKKENALNISLRFPVFVFNARLLNSIRNDVVTLYKFFNIVLSFYDKSYLKALSDYSRALREKRALLTFEGENDTINAWNTIILERSKILRKKRENFVKKINNSIEEDLKVVYKVKISEKEEKSLFQREIKEKRVLTGCHKDRFFILNKNKDMRLFLSSGQQKAVFFDILKTIGFIFSEKTGKKPVLLLDDFDSEFDNTNLSNSLKRVISNFQIVLTTTDKRKFANFDFNLLSLG